jgi:NAD+ kinase
VSAPTAIGVLTHRSASSTSAALESLLDAAREAGISIRLPADEAEKHGMAARPGVEIAADLAAGCDLCVVLGGDGTILRALRTFAGTGVPTFAINYGEIGFLATVDDPGEGLPRILTGDFETLSMPALGIDTGSGPLHAAGDISFHRLAGNRVAHVYYSVDGEELGRVRCDGLVAATPVGSTGYNLANGGPLLAWGVEGFVVSFVAPHSLTARPLVVSPGSTLAVENQSDSEELEITTDGRPVGVLAPGESIEVRFVPDAMALAQLPGFSFYHRLREKFGRIAY